MRFEEDIRLVGETTGNAIMVQGAASSVGKSWLVAALCRIYARRGLRVAPFKAQNMSNNAAVCPDGTEIGRAQAVQALAAGIEPTADMNPILIKPEADSRAQIVVTGKPWRTLTAGEYYRYKEDLWPVVTAALDHLRTQYDLVIIEGAGSPAELNLKAGDIVNMAVARYAGVPVLLVGDIDRGGIFAQLLGTLWLLPPEEQAMVRGFVVNKFRGDPALFTNGGRILEERSGLPVLGVIPYVPDLLLPEEDAATLPNTHTSSLAASSAPALDIAVIHLPHIANFDDFDALRAEPGVRVRFVTSLVQLGSPDAIILPGTKSSVADLLWLKRVGLAKSVAGLARAGVAVVGICGGYQMLGQAIDDADHVESEQGHIRGLGLLPTVTTFAGEKATYRVRAYLQSGPGWLARLAGQVISGYEIHMGRTKTETPWIHIVERGGTPVHVHDGAVSADGRVWGTYLHSIFTNDALRRAWLTELRDRHHGVKSAPVVQAEAMVEASLDRLADVVEAELDMERLDALIGGLQET